jgi:hypothetical protein
MNASAPPTTTIESREPYTGPDEAKEQALGPTVNSQLRTLLEDGCFSSADEE